MQSSESAASSIYNSRLSERHQSLKELMRRARVAGYVRGVMGILIPATLWLAFVPHLVSAWLTVIPAAAFLALHKYYEDTYLKLNRVNRYERSSGTGVRKMRQVRCTNGTRSIGQASILRSLSGSCGHALRATRVSGGSTAKASNENAGRGGIDDNHDLMHWRRFQNPVP